MVFDLIESLFLPNHFVARVVLNGPELDEILAALRVEIAERLGDLQRQLALLAFLALVDDGPDSAHDFRIVPPRGDRRRGPRLLIAKLRAQPLPERNEF